MRETAAAAAAGCVCRVFHRQNPRRRRSLSVTGPYHSVCVGRVEPLSLGWQVPDIDATLQGQMYSLSRGQNWFRECQRCDSTCPGCSGAAAGETDMFPLSDQFRRRCIFLASPFRSFAQAFAKLMRAHGETPDCVSVRAVRWVLDTTAEAESGAVDVSRRSIIGVQFDDVPADLVHVDNPGFCVYRCFRGRPPSKYIAGESQFGDHRDSQRPTPTKR